MHRDIFNLPLFVFFYLLLQKSINPAKFNIKKQWLITILNIKNDTVVQCLINN